MSDIFVSFSTDGSMILIVSTDTVAKSNILAQSHDDVAGKIRALEDLKKVIGTKFAGQTVKRSYLTACDIYQRNNLLQD